VLLKQNAKKEMDAQRNYNNGGKQVNTISFTFEEEKTDEKIKN
jgi:hypothetical protein